MSRRGEAAEHEEELAKLSLDELDEEIARCRMRLTIAQTRYQRKAFESRIHWLESFRKRRFGG